VSQDAVLKVLKDLGLTNKEADLYIFLAKHGVQKGGDLAKLTKTHKALVYRVLKSLEGKGLVESTLESPTRFSAVTFEKVLDLNIRAKREEAALIEKTKQDLLSDWENISKPGSEPLLDKFRVIEGKNKIYPKISQMVKETKAQLSVVSNVSNLLRADQFGIFDSIPISAASEINYRFLTELSNRNLDAVKVFLERIPKTGFHLKGRNPDLGLKLFPQMVIRDEAEVLFFITPKTKTVASPDYDNNLCLWTNCGSLVQAFKGVFEELWANSTEIKEKIIELETGKPTKPMSLISDVKVAERKYFDALEAAQNEIILVVGKDDLVSVQNTPPLNRAFKRGAAVKVMAPITHDNLEAALTLSKLYEVRHVQPNYFKTAVIDEKHIFQFFPEKTQTQTDTKCESVLYGNDADHIKKVAGMLNALWKTSPSPSGVTVESVLYPAPPGTSSIFNQTRFTKSRNVNAISVEDVQIGLLSEKDVLKKIINAQKTPNRDFSEHEDIYYGSTAAGIIHPPKFFNLPDILIQAWHFNKQSTHGAEDGLIISLWLETPIGQMYVPVAYVGDNPQAVAHRKAVLSMTPAGENARLLKKDEFQVTVQGNSFFAGWIVPITLFPPPYVLLPSAILFEGIGELKTAKIKTRMITGRKQEWEVNGFEAFVTFIHPASSYSGPGTDGLLFRDVITKTYPPN
jgi:sugar-specific transcriptional regulator TrmB